MRHKLAAIGMVLLLVTVAGCSSLTGGGGGDGGTADWCAEGQAPTMELGQLPSDSQASMTVDGVVEREGQELCMLSYEYAELQDGRIASMEVFFSQDGSDYLMVIYGPDGAMLNSYGTLDEGIAAGSGSGSASITTIGSAPT